MSQNEGTIATLKDIHLFITVFFLTSKTNIQ